MLSIDKNVNIDYYIAVQKLLSMADDAYTSEYVYNRLQGFLRSLKHNSEANIISMQTKGKWDCVQIDISGNTYTVYMDDDDKRYKIEEID